MNVKNKEHGSSTSPTVRMHAYFPSHKPHWITTTTNSWSTSPSRVHGHSPASNSSHVSADGFFLSGSSDRATVRGAPRMWRKARLWMSFLWPQTMNIYETCQLKCPNSQNHFHHFPKHRDVQACLRKYCAVKTRNGWKRIADPLDQHPSLWPVSSQLFFLLLIPCSLHLFQESSPSIGCLVPENWRNPWIWSLQHLREANSTRERLPVSMLVYRISVYH